MDQELDKLRLQAMEKQPEKDKAVAQLLLVLLETLKLLELGQELLQQAETVLRQAQDKEVVLLLLALTELLVQLVQDQVVLQALEMGLLQALELEPAQVVPLVD